MPNKRQPRRTRAIGGPPFQVIWEPSQTASDILVVATTEGGCTMSEFLHRAVKSQYQNDVKRGRLPKVVDVSTAVPA